jgi:hypothetical protein
MTFWVPRFFCSEDLRGHRFRASTSIGGEIRRYLFHRVETVRPERLRPGRNLLTVVADGLLRPLMRRWTASKIAVKTAPQNTAIACIFTIKPHHPQPFTPNHITISSTRIQSIYCLRTKIVDRFGA